MAVTGSVTQRVGASSGTGPRSSILAVGEGGCPLCDDAPVPREKEKGVLCVGMGSPL